MLETNKTFSNAVSGQNSPFSNRAQPKLNAPPNLFTLDQSVSGNIRLESQFTSVPPSRFQPVNISSGEEPTLADRTDVEIGDLSSKLEENTANASVLGKLDDLI